MTKHRQVALKGSLPPKKIHKVNLDETEAERRARWKREAEQHRYSYSVWKSWKGAR
ncbi:hypothetical protein P9272_31410 [Mesorhizobium sp. WSM4976]|uniref:hypothetical protein n=1 Tax=unclassified Mesorhizobium TaxID=325217 RepID=UPI0015964D27|nr:MULTISPECIES: hypothetical protein [unclassified Mesorhizobium]MDG4898052.1 hypothetical protein [Mesorhizobium sp. WSM4976]